MYLDRVRMRSECKCLCFAIIYVHFEHTRMHFKNIRLQFEGIRIYIELRIHECIWGINEYQCVSSYDAIPIT